VNFKQLRGSIVYVTVFNAFICTIAWVLDAQAQDMPIGILLAAGDIATCSSDRIRSGQATADLIKQEISVAKEQNVEVRVLALGDLSYPSGSAKSFKCFDASWGQFKDKILPVPGNHDYESNNGAAYFTYFSSILTALKADKQLAVYSLDFPNLSSSVQKPWRLIALNSNKSTGAKSQQLKWLDTELRKTNGKQCVLAFSHAFFYSSGRHGHDDGNGKPQNSKIDLIKPLLPGEGMRSIFQTLYVHRASVFVAGHDHHYEQLGRANYKGDASDQGKAAMVADGIRSFVVGTGGKRLYSDNYQQKWMFNEAHDLESYGILKIELYPTSYKWVFIPMKDNSRSMKVIKDVKSDTCNLLP